jgi:succinoglycan biosynthesis transport protein ExoP
MDRRQTDRRLNANRDLYVLDIEGIVKTLCRRRTLLITFMLMVLVPSVLFVLFRPESYVAQTSVILEDTDLNLTDFKDALPTQTLDDMTIETQVKVIGSSTLAHETLDTLAKAEKAPAIAIKAAKPKDRYESLKTFLKNLAVASEGKSRVISIAYKTNDPYEAAQIVNTHTQQYIDFQIRSKKEKIGLVNEWITQQVAALRENSQKKSQAIQEFRKESGIILGKNSQELIYQQITDLTEQLIPIETQKLNLQARAAAKGSTAEVVDSDLIKDLKSQASAAKQELKSLSATYGPNHPDVLSAKARVKQANTDLANETGMIHDSVQVELESITTQEGLIRERLEALSKEADALREKSIALESLEAEETANRTLLENFLTRSEELKSQLDYNSGDVRIVALADVPTQPVGTSKKILFVLAGIFSIVFAAGMVLLLELVDRGIEDAEDIKKILNLRLLGILPKVRNPVAEVDQLKRSPYTEELKRIYMAISQKKEPQSILFTASRSGEGKTTVSFALARYLASIGMRTILVDANTTSPSIAELAGVNKTPGFAELLTRAADLSKSVHKDDMGLSIIPAGNPGSYGIDVLSSVEIFRKLMGTLKTQYDFIIVDCAPVLNTTDAEIIAAHVDQVVLVIEWAKSPKKYLNKVAGILRQFSKETPGVILNKRP